MNDNNIKTSIYSIINNNPKICILNKKESVYLKNKQAIDDIINNISQEYSIEEEKICCSHFDINENKLTIFFKSPIFKLIISQYTDDLLNMLVLNEYFSNISEIKLKILPK